MPDHVPSLISAAAVLTLLTACGGTEETAPSPSPETHGPGSGTEGTEAPEAGGPENEPVSEASWDPESVHVLVNKENPLEPADHEPSDLTVPDVPMEFEGQQLREEAAVALEELFAAAEEDGVELLVTTAYRGYDHQLALYEGYAEEMGQEAADEVSARPGYSEHQTGLAADFSHPGNEDCYLSACFGETEAGQWLAENGHDHGFIIRYPEGAQDITGFSYEPWQLRYVGEETAAAVVAQDVTLEEYWDQPAAPDYAD